MTSARKAILDFPTAALAVVMGSLNFVIQRQDRASTVGGLQLEETVKSMKFMCTLVFSLFLLFCSHNTLKGPLSRNSTTFKYGVVAMGGEDCVIPLSFKILL